MLSSCLLSVVLSGAFLQPTLVAGPGPRESGPQFSQCDRNRDGVVDRQEFDEVMKRMPDRGPRERGPNPPSVGGWHVPEPGAAGSAHEPFDAQLQQRIDEAVQRALRDAVQQHREEIRRMIREELRNAHERKGKGDRPAWREKNDGADMNRGPGKPDRENQPPQGPLGGPRRWHERSGPGPGAGEDRRDDMKGEGLRDRPFRDQGNGDGGPREEMKRDRKHRGDKKGLSDGEFMEKVERLFERMDQNDNGFVERGEFRGEAKRFERTDRNHDGKIDHEEFVTALSKARKRGAPIFEHGDKEGKPPQGQGGGRRGPRGDRPEM